MLQAKEDVVTRSRPLLQQRLVSSSRSVVSVDTSVKESSPHEWEQELLYILQQFWSIFAPKSWNSLETLRAIIRRAVSVGAMILDLVCVFLTKIVFSSSPYYTCYQER